MLIHAELHLLIQEPTTETAIQIVQLLPEDQLRKILLPDNKVIIQETKATHLPDLTAAHQAIAAVADVLMAEAAAVAEAQDHPEEAEDNNHLKPTQ